MDSVKSVLRRMGQARTVLRGLEPGGSFENLPSSALSAAFSPLRQPPPSFPMRRSPDANGFELGTSKNLSSRLDEFGVPFPEELLEKPPLIKPTWSVSEYGELHGEHRVDDYPRFYFFGDSLTDRAFKEDEKGFGWLLRKQYEGKVEIVNRGFSGYNSKWLHDAFQDFIIDVAEKRGPPAPLLITIWLGYEDAHLPPLAVHVPLKEFEQHLRRYVRAILDHPGMKDTRIVLITPPPTNVKQPQEPPIPFPGSTEIQRNMVLRTRAHRTWLSKRKYAEKVVEIGEEFEDKTLRVAVIDLWYSVTRWACSEEINGVSTGFDELDEIDTLPGCGLPKAKVFREEIFSDSIHLGKKAHEILASELLDLIRGRWPEISPESLPLQEQAPSDQERMFGVIADTIAGMKEIH
ncbi:hypothetical protein VTN00DRAFT_9834 [Thermoascus crustaceus]|uniref:uncharacterized protein n=1 Tax=Thermoascus crustaceus TaxID=5088 RepID=UPI0037448E9F